MIQASDVLEIALRKGFQRDQVDAALRSLSDDEVTRLGWMADWVDTRHDHQVVPDGDWDTWLIMAGRGAGKTRVGAEWIGMEAAMTAAGQENRSLVAAPTIGDLRAVCFEGESGLVSVIPSSLVKSAHTSGRPEMTLHNGAIIGGIAAETPNRFRGPNWHRGWADELAAWGETGRCDPQDAWDTMAMSVRLGSHARILATTTPRNRPHIKAIMAEKGTVVTGASTYVNLDNLSPVFARRILKYDGTKIGRQEIYAELIDSEDGGIIRREWLKLWPHDKPLPMFDYIVMSLDTAFSEEAFDKKRQTTDPSACSVWGCFKLKNGKPAVLLLDCWAEYLGLPELVEKVKRESKLRYGQTDKRPVIAPQRGPMKTMDVGRPIDIILIEEKASGKSLRQFLAKAGIDTYGFNPGNADKLTRGHVISPIPKDGIIWVPGSAKSTPEQPKFATWAEPLVEQVCSYSGPGTTVHDDLYDTTTQGLRVIDWQWLHYLDAAKKRKAAGLDGPDVRTRRTFAATSRLINPYSQ